MLSYTRSKLGASGWLRTNIFWFKRPTLCQLSYGSKLAEPLGHSSNLRRGEGATRRWGRRSFLPVPVSPFPRVSVLAVRVERFELITKLILSQPPLPIGLHAREEIADWRLPIDDLAFAPALPRFTGGRSLKRLGRNLINRQLAIRNLKSPEPRMPNEFLISKVTGHFKSEIHLC
jgi:hypothetical protein